MSPEILAEIMAEILEYERRRDEELTSRERSIFEDAYKIGQVSAYRTAMSDIQTICLGKK